MKPWSGYYINLDTDIDKKVALESVLIKNGIRPFYSRFKAVPGSDVDEFVHTPLSEGEKGCWMSHLRLLESKQDSSSHLHIIEDDFIPAHNFLETATNLLALLEHQEWDMLFTNFFFSPEPAVFTQIHQLFRNWEKNNTFGVVNLRSISFAGTTSYFVNNTSINKVLNKLKSGLGLPVPIDLYLRKLSHEGQLTILGTVPFLSTISPAESSIRATDLSRHIFKLFRHSFFLDSNQQHILNEISKLVGNSATHPQQHIFLKLMQHIISTEYKPF